MSQVINTTLSKAITSADGFHHLVYSISGNIHTLFLDNSAIAVNISGGNIFSSYQNITNLFCGIAGDLSYGYTGYIDDFKVYNRALMAADVSSIYNSIITPVSTTTVFTVNSIPGLIFQLDATNTSSLTLTGSYVTQWKDLVNNVTFTPVTSNVITYNATGINSKPIVSFPGSQGAWLRAYTNLGLTNSTRYFYYFVVFQYTRISNNDCLFGLVDRTTNPISNNLLFYLNVTNPNTIISNSSFTADMNVTFFSASSNNNIMCLMLEYNGTNMNQKIRYNGIQSNQVTANLFNTLNSSNTSFGIGDSTYGNIFGGSMSEILMYAPSSALTSTQIQQVEGYLAWKWGINSSLPTTHLYYGSAPTISTSTSVPVSPYSSYAITSTAQLLFPLTADLTNKGVYSSYASSNVTIASGTPTYATYGTKLGANNGYINISGLYATNLFKTGYTLSMWFYLNSTNGDWNNNPLYTLDSANSQLFSWNPCNAPWNRTGAGLYFGANSVGLNATYSVNNTWQQVVVTVDSNKLCTYYLNGYNWGTSSPANALNLDSIQLFNQAWSWTAATLYPTPGRFLCLFNSVLTSTQVTALYNEQTNIV